MKKSTKVQHLIRYGWIVTQLQESHDKINNFFDKTGNFPPKEIQKFHNLFVDLTYSTEEVIHALERDEDYEACQEIKAVYDSYFQYIKWIEEHAN